MIREAGNYGNVENSVKQVSTYVKPLAGDRAGIARAVKEELDPEGRLGLVVNTATLHTPQ